MFDKMFFIADHFNKEIGEKKWDQIRLVLKQPYSYNKQMGIDSMNVFGASANQVPEVGFETYETAMCMLRHLLTVAVLFNRNISLLRN